MWEDNSKHCFACGYHVFPKTYSIKEVNYGPKSLLPFDFTREVPGHAWKWLLQWGLGINYWKESAGYSPSQQRLILRVGDTTLTEGRLLRCGTPLAFSLGRYLPKENEPSSSVSSPAMPDAVRDFLLRQRGKSFMVRNSAPAKWLSYGDCHRHAEVIGETQGDSSIPVVLVEDLISGHKVAASGYTSIPLFGTKVHPPVLYYLLNCSNPVVLWLDKDQEGNVKREAIRLQALINRPVALVTTDKDPKALSIEEIKKALP